MAFLDCQADLDEQVLLVPLDSWYVFALANPIRMAFNGEVSMALSSLFPVLQGLPGIQGDVVSILNAVNVINSGNLKLDHFTMMILWVLCGSMFHDLFLIPGISRLSRTSGAKRWQGEFHSWVYLQKKLLYCCDLLFLSSAQGPLVHMNFWVICNSSSHHLWELSFSLARRYLMSSWRKLLSSYHKSLACFSWIFAEAGSCWLSHSAFLKVFIVNKPVCTRLRHRKVRFQDQL